MTERTPTKPGLYLDAVGEVWRVRAAGDPCRPATFDELLEQAITAGPDQAARSGPFTPLLALDSEARDLLLNALSLLSQELNEEEEWNEGAAAGYYDWRRRAIRDLIMRIEALG